MPRDRLGPPRGTAICNTAGQEDGFLGTTKGGFQNGKNQEAKRGVGVSSGFQTRRLLGALGSGTWLRGVHPVREYKDILSAESAQSWGRSQGIFSSNGMVHLETAFKVVLNIRQPACFPNGQTCPFESGF